MILQFFRIQNLGLNCTLASIQLLNIFRIPQVVCSDLLALSQLEVSSFISAESFSSRGHTQTNNLSGFRPHWFIFFPFFAIHFLEKCNSLRNNSFLSLEK